MATSPITDNVGEETSGVSWDEVNLNGEFELSEVHGEHPPGGLSTDTESFRNNGRLVETSLDCLETSPDAMRHTDESVSNTQDYVECASDLGDDTLIVTSSKTSGNDGVVELDVDSSSSSVMCRICHMSEKETGEVIGTTDCDCRGGLESVHRSCLIQWVTYKRNNRCELCGVSFPCVSPPQRSVSVERQRRRIEAVYQQYTRLRPMTRRKRAFLGSLSIFLIITTSATGILTVSTEREFQRIHLDPWASGQERMESYVTFSICLSFLLFCATLTVGVLLIWLVLEGSYYRRRERFYSFAQRIARQDGIDELG